MTKLSSGDKFNSRGTPYSREDATLETLLDFDGKRYYLESGYWIKFCAKRVEPDAYRPFGVSYAITLHDRNNTRVLGFDNAHRYKPKRKKYGARKITWDHKHDRDRVEPYEFESASQLLEDFWREVEKIT